MKYIFLLASMLLLASCQSPQKTIDKDKIRLTIRDNIDKFQSCYENYLKRDSKAYGRIVFEWTIVEKGAVKDPKISKNTFEKKDPVFEKCMIDTLSSLTFPEPPSKNEAIVSYPMVFNSNNKREILKK